MSNDSPIERAIGGGLAGVAATAPMSLVMEALYRRLPSLETSPLPPRQIVGRLTRLVGLTEHLGERERRITSLVAHFGFGGAMGMLYPFIGRPLARSPATAGAAYGLLVWATSYLGVLPKLGLLKPATRESASRNALMVAAHLAWGAAAGLVSHALTDARDNGFP